MSRHNTSIVCNIENVHSISPVAIELPAWPKEESWQVVLDIINFILSRKPNIHFVTRKHDLVILEVVDKTGFFYVEYFDIISRIIAVNLLLNLEHDFWFSDFATDYFE